jgi:hypothetical protein
MLAISALVALGCTACAERQETAVADPVELDLFFASLQEPAEAMLSEAELKQRKLAQRADRYGGTLEKLQVERINPATAAALISR